MNDWRRLRTWAGALTIGSFIVMSVTGILMFFHLNVGMIKLAHEGMSWLFVLGAVLHVVINWRAFLGYFRTPLGAVIIGILVLVGAVSFLPVGGPHGRPPFMEIMGAMEQASLELVAQVLKRDPQTLIQQLQAQGIQVRQPTQTLAEIAAQNQKHSMEIWAALFSPQNRPN